MNFDMKSNFRFICEENQENFLGVQEQRQIRAQKQLIARNAPDPTIKAIH